LGVSKKIYEWTQVFSGDAEKDFLPNHMTAITQYLEYYAPFEPGLVAALATEQLNIEGLYLTSTTRQMLAQHIITLNILATVFLPVYVGLDNPTNTAIQIITDKLFRDRTLLVIANDSSCGGIPFAVATSCHSPSIK
jgi:hypothetical protein